MDTHNLFFKLEEHEMEIKKSAIDEEIKKKIKSIALKAKKSNFAGDMSLIEKNS